MSFAGKPITWHDEVAELLLSICSIRRRRLAKSGEGSSAIRYPDWRLRAVLVKWSADYLMTLQFGIPMDRNDTTSCSRCRPPLDATSHRRRSPT